MALKKSDLEEIKDPAIIERYLKITQSLHETISCYFKTTDSFFSAKSLGGDVSTKRFSLDIRRSEINPEKFRQDFINCMDRTISLSFRAQDTLFYCKTKIVSVQQEVINLELPAAIYKMQRRANLRLRIEDGSQANCNIPGAFDTNQNIYDISAGGLSVLTSKSHAEKLPIGMPLLNAEVFFQGIRVKIDLDIRSHTEVETVRGRFIKVGFRFRSLPPALEQKIVQAAVSQNQKILAKKI